MITDMEPVLVTALYKKITKKPNNHPSDSHTLRFSIKYGRFSSPEEAVNHRLAAKLT